MASPLCHSLGTAKSIDLTSEMDPCLRGDDDKIMISDGPTRSMGSDRKARPAVLGALADRQLIKNKVIDQRTPRR